MSKKRRAREFEIWIVIVTLVGIASVTICKDIRIDKLMLALDALEASQTGIQSLTSLQSELSKEPANKYILVKRAYYIVALIESECNPSLYSKEDDVHSIVGG